MAPEIPVSFDSYGGSAPENYEKFFVPAVGRPFAVSLMKAAALQPGERVLDVACGTGVVARMAASAVGSAGQVTALDMNEDMLKVAKAATDLPIGWRQSSAESMPFEDDQYDVVLCQLGLQFFPDREGALKEMFRVLAPGGRLALNVCGPTPFFFKALGKSLADHVSPELKNFVEQVFSLYEPEQLIDLLKNAGFQNVMVDRGELTLNLPPPAEFLWQYVHSTPLAPAVAKVGKDVHERIQNQVLAELRTGASAPAANGAVKYTTAWGSKLPV